MRGWLALMAVACAAPEAHVPAPSPEGVPALAAPAPCPRSPELHPTDPFPLALQVAGAPSPYDAWPAQVAYAEARWLSAGVPLSLEAPLGSPMGPLLRQDGSWTLPPAPTSGPPVHVWVVPRIVETDGERQQLAGLTLGPDTPGLPIDWVHALGERRVVVVSPLHGTPGTLAHELGHALGLDHAARGDNLMHPQPPRCLGHLTSWQIRKLRRPQVPSP